MRFSRTPAVTLAVTLASLVAVTAPHARADAPPGVSVQPIEGYASEVSVRPGGVVHLHVSTNPPATYRIDVVRLDLPGPPEGFVVACVQPCGSGRPGEPELVPAADPVTGLISAKWPITDTFTIPRTFESGYYAFRFVLTGGPKAGESSATTVIVRELPHRHSTILVQVPVNTWQAYNGWGGKSFYPFTSLNGAWATHISFDRPYTLPDMPYVWELQAARFLAREGYSVSYQTDVDTDRAPASLLHHRLVVVAGHGEYWTRAMRDAFDAARDSGTNLAFLGANTAYWQARYEDDRRTVVEYRSTSDPTPDPQDKTVLFRDLGWAECELLGVQFQGEMDVTDYSVMPSALGDPWMAGTGFEAGSVLRGLVGPERDSIPVFLPPPCAKPGLTTFFHAGPIAPLGESGTADAVRYVAPSGAIIFSSGSLRFSWGLDAVRSRTSADGAVDPHLQAFMRNALDDMTRPAPPVAVRAEVRARRVFIVAGTHADPRLRSVRFLRSDAGDASAPVTICAGKARVCVDRPAPGTYRYSAVVSDAWRDSHATSAPVVTVR